MLLWNVAVSFNGSRVSIYTQVWPQVGDGREKKVKHSEEEGEPPDDVRRPPMRGVTREAEEAP